MKIQYRTKAKVFTSALVLSFSPFHSVGIPGRPSLCCISRKTVKYLQEIRLENNIEVLKGSYLLHPTVRTRRFIASICVISTAVPFPASNICKTRPL
jgi:hypothetical protein